MLWSWLGMALLLISEHLLYAVLGTRCFRTNTRNTCSFFLNLINIYVFSIIRFHSLVKYPVRLKNTLNIVEDCFLQQNFMYLAVSAVL